MLWKNNRNRWKALLCVFCMLVGLVGVCPQTVYALEFTKDSDGNLNASDADGYYYMVPSGGEDSGECVLYLYGGTSSDLVLPKTCGSYQVTTVGTNFSLIVALFGESYGIADNSLTTVKIPSGYTTIESGDNGQTGAFQNQTKLYRVEIPASVTTIGENAFDGCDFNKLTIVTPHGSAAEEYAIEHGIHYTTSKKLAIKTGNKTMYVGQKKKIVVYNNGKTITWKSSKPSVATISKNGVITAKKAGKTKITVKIGKKKYRYTFTVKKRG